MAWLVGIGNGCRNPDDPKPKWEDMIVKPDDDEEEEKCKCPDYYLDRI